MSTRDNRESVASGTSQTSGWRSAYDRTIQITNTVLAPVVIIKLVVDLQGLLDFLIRHIWPSLLIFLILIALFLFNLIDLKDLKRSISGTASKFRWRYLRIVVYMLSAGALVALLTVGVLSMTSGIHFVIVASAPSEAAADREVEQINTVLAKKNVDGLHARAYASGGNNPWYGIVLGGPHFSMQAAIETLDKARRIIPQDIDAGAWIKSYDLRKWIGQVTG